MILFINETNLGLMVIPLSVFFISTLFYVITNLLIMIIMHELRESFPINLCGTKFMHTPMGNLKI